MQKTVYDKKFYENQQKMSLQSAEYVVPLVYEMIKPKSVIDVGCGVGTWLSVFNKKYDAKITGVDGAYVDKKMLQISKENFISHDLETSLKIDKKFDLAMSLEVAEHLSLKRANSFVKDLVNLSDVVLFSAANVGQGGTNHINCQLASYWEKIFKSYDYVALDCIRPLLYEMEMGKIEPWYVNNVILYVKNTVLSEFEKNNPCLKYNCLDVIGYQYYLKLLNSYTKVINFLPIRLLSKIKRKFFKQV